MGNPIILDANSVIVRCIMASAMDDLKAGEIWTGGVYGTLNTLRSFLSSPELNPERVYAFFDAGVPAFRKKLLPDYKEHRKERRELLTEEQKAKAFEQLGMAKDMLELLGVICLAYKDREADDGVAAAARIFTEDDRTPVVVSGDKDLWQVVEWGARVWYASPKKSCWVDDSNFRERVAESFKCEGVEPESYLLFKALVGDASDGIPGADGCGPKRAATLLNELDFDGSPESQLRLLCEELRKKSKLKKFEQSVLDSEKWLEKVLKGIDLYYSFGKLTGLKKALQRPAKVRKIRFLKFCKRLQFKSVLGDPDRSIKPFARAAGG